MRVKAMLTVEMTYIMGVILFVFFLCVMGLFYYHDKEILSACAYEAAVVGSTKLREEKSVEEAVVDQLFQERIDGKCILFGNPKGEVFVKEDRIEVKVGAQRKQMKVSVKETAVRTRPEEIIRKYRKLGVRK